ncbi:DNA-binding protein [Ralstonia pickettii]|jgi:chromosome segregation ATPase|uniref:DNA-binding protein n=1 Tax=Ralstonia pickettii TaxID=329 RepID=UPI0015F85B5E|nr:DNA-binding protein [Ralstonia pickettii]MBB0025518.1 DNA-binding protein [Ralstonia pickettii]MBB0036146.1 DNA-binding protein [Ralstonia pickettii]MBB0098846.1 DNA-binding protein [Ralstonia pickettii]MBB0108797.1 DNA-binding protein [Ralstonia pickettii]MBB0129620.1 DNA-binding protein [Ralstonia pickettii]
MSKRIVTEMAVHEAADALHSAGTAPTTIKVQERTGGSFTTVHRYLKTWEEARARDAAAAPDTPTTLTARAEGFIRALWIEAIAIAREEVRRVKEQAGQEATRMAAELAEAQEIVERLEAVEANQARQLADQDAALRKNEQELVEATVLARQLPELHRALNGVRVELEAARHEVMLRAVDIGKLEGEAEALREQVKELTATLGTSRGAAKR